MLTDRIRNISDNQSGVALVMALVILILVMTSSLIFGNFLRNELRMSLNSINSISAFLAADSGLERGLFYLKHGVKSSDMTLFDQLETDGPFIISGFDASYDYISASVSSYVPTPIELFNGEHTFSAYDIAASNSAQVSILDPTGDVTSINWGPDPVGLNYTYRVYWKVEDCFPDHSSDRLEISQVSFTSNFNNLDTKSRVVVCNCAFNSADWCDNTLSQFSIEDDKYYRFHFKPIDDAVEQIGFDLYEDDDIIGIQSQAFIDVKGINHNSQYSLQARIPAISPLNDAFNYIIFSEEPLIKDL